MKLIIKRAVDIDGVHYKMGSHDLDDKYLDHWFINAIVKDGLAEFVEEQIIPEITMPEIIFAEEPKIDLAEEKQSDSSVGKKKFNKKGK